MNTESQLADIALSLMVNHPSKGRPKQMRKGGCLLLFSWPLWVGTLTETPGMTELIINDHPMSVN